VVDNRNTVVGPAQSDRAIDEGILTGGGLLMLEDLLGRGLADVDDGGAVKVPGAEFGRTQGISHDRPPCGAGPDEAGRGVVRAGRVVAAAGSTAGESTAVGLPGSAAA